MPEMTDIRCEECGAVYPMLVGDTKRTDQHVWSPGKKCPICGSQKFLPVVKTVEPKPIAKWKLDRRVGIAAGVTAAVFLLIGLIWYFHERPHRKGGVKALYMCDVCGERFISGVKGNVPKKCPECKSRAAYRAVQCQSCFQVYPWKVKAGAADPATCPNPKCKSEVSKFLLDFSDIQKKPKPPKKPEEEPEEGETDEEE